MSNSGVSVQEHHGLADAGLVPGDIRRVILVAEGMGFDPTNPEGLAVFK